MNMHAFLQVDPSSSEPQLDNGVPALPAAPAGPPSVPAAPDALNVPADAGGIAGGGVQTAREEKRKVCDLFCASSTISSLQVPSCTHNPLVLLPNRLQVVTKPRFSSHYICSTLAD